MHQEIYEIATDKGLSLAQRSKKTTAILLPFKDEIMLKNEHWQPRHIKAIENKTGFLSLKDKTAERDFWGRFFKIIFEHFPHIESFSWEQREDFNDSYYYYNVTNFKLNDNDLYIFTGLDGFDFLQEQYFLNFLTIHEMRDWVWDAIYAKTATEQEVDDFWVNGKITDIDIEELFSLYFENAIAAILVWFQSLYEAFTADYFVELFGWESSVKITREGFFITL